MEVCGSAMAKEAAREYHCHMISKWIKFAEEIAHNARKGVAIEQKKLQRILSSQKQSGGTHRSQ